MIRARPSLPVRIVSGASLLVVVAVLAAWATRILPRRASIDHFNAVKSLDTLGEPAATPYVVAIALGLAALAVLRRPSLADPRVAAAGIGAAALGLAAPLATVLGHQVLVLVCAVALAVLLGVHLPRRGPRDASPTLARATPWLLWIGVAALHATFSMHRHAWYGSGSWDHGCMIHNFYRASRFLDSTSTVLGNVDFLGDHFMIGIYLYAPFNWLNASGYMVLLVQAVNLAAVAPAIFLMARHHRIAHGPAVALALATSLSFGLQSAAFFDSHEITVGFGFLAWGLWAFETGRLRAATVLLVVFALFKESLGAYVVGLGMLALWRGARGRDRRLLRYGLGWIVFGAVWFVLVNRVFMPALIARAKPPEPHETFGDFGPTIFEAALGIATHPLKAMAAIFVPDEKLLSLGVTLGGTGGLALLSPQVGIAALPLFAERFLSSKTTMWQMGYHYAAPLSLYAGWAGVRGWATAERRLARGLRGLGDGLRALAPALLTVYLLLAALGINGFGYRHPSNYFKWREGYFATPAQKAAADAAIALLEAQGRDARISAQNRLLPHLADRPVIYRLGDWSQADWVLLSVGTNAWPWTTRFPGQVAKKLDASPEWVLVFAEDRTAVFARAAVTELPAVPPTPGLGLRRPKAAPPPRPKLQLGPASAPKVSTGARGDGRTIPKVRVDSPDSNR